MREVCRTNGAGGGGGGGTVVATTVAIFEHHRLLNGNNINSFDDSITYVDGDKTRKRSPVTPKNNYMCLENAVLDNPNQYKRRNGRVATTQQYYCDEKFESAVKDFNLVAEDVENSLRRQKQQCSVKTAEVSSGSENGRYVRDMSSGINVLHVL